MVLYHPKEGDRAAFDSLEHPEVHGTDLKAGTPTVHTPSPVGQTGKSIVSDGLKWILGTGAEAVKLDDLQPPDDNTDLNATSLAHGLLPKLAGVATKVLSGLGTWIDLVTTFLGLSDTPASYTGMAGKVVKVKGTEDGLEFGDASTVGSLDDLDDVNAPTPADGEVLTWDEAAGEWINAEPTGGGGVAGSLLVTKSKKLVRTVLYDNVLSGAGVWDVQNIPQTYDHLEILMSIRSDQATSVSTYSWWANNDLVAGNYWGDWHYGGNSHSATDLASSQLGQCGGTTAPANYFTHVTATIQNYTRTDRYKEIQWVSGEYRVADTSGWIESGKSARKSTEAINRLKFAANAGSNNFIAGSRLQIIGIREEDVVSDVQSSGMATPVNTTKKKLQTRAVLFDQTLAVDGIWDVQNIDQTYDHLEILVHGRGTGVNAWSWILCYLNNDTTASNYETLRHIWDYGGTHLGQALAQPTLGVLGGAGDGVANRWGHLKAFLPNYTQSDKNKLISVYGLGSDGNTSVESDGMHWKSTSPVNRITIKASSDGTTPVNMKAGSRLQIIGIKEEEVVTEVTGSGGLAADQEIYGKFVVSDETLGSNTTFSSVTIPQDYDNLEIVLSNARSTSANTESGVQITLNGDTTDANYRRIRHYVESNNTHAVAGADDRQIGAIPGSLATPAQAMGNVHVLISGYRDTSHYKMLDCNSIMYNSGEQYEWRHSVGWENGASAISTIAIPGTFTAGSRLQIFGYKKTRVASSAPVVLKNPFLGRPTGTLLRQYTFDSDAQGWIADSGTLIQENGWLKYTGAGSNGSALEPVGASNVADGEFKCLYKLGSASEGGLIFRATDADNHYLFIIRHNTLASPSIVLYKKVASVYSIIWASPTGSTPLFTWGIPISVLIRFVGPQISMYWNDSLVASVYDTTYTTGRVGMRCGTENNGTEFLDNVQVYSIPSNWNIDSYTQTEWVGKVSSEFAADFTTLILEEDFNAGFLPSGWTQSGSGTSDFLTKNSYMQLNLSAINIERLLYYDALNIAGDFEVIGKFSLDSYSTTANSSGAWFYAYAGANSIADTPIFNVSGEDHYRIYSVIAGTSHTANNKENPKSIERGLFIYIKLKRVSGTVYTYWSQDGITWQLMYSDASAGTLTKVQARIYTSNGTTVSSLKVHWIKVYTP